MNALIILTAVVAVAFGQNVVPVPVKYTTVENYAVDAGKKILFSADIGCDQLGAVTIDICAELPLNWQWNPFSGLVFLNVYNNSLDTDDLDKALASTGRPDKPYTKLDKCITLNKWPGGDLYIRVDPNNYAPVVFTVSVKMTFNQPIATNPSTKVVLRNIPKPIVHNKPAKVSVGQIVPLQPVVLLSEPMSLQFDKTVTLELNLCLAPHTGSNQLLTTTVMAKTGTYTHFICKGLPCQPDAPTVIGSVNSPLPAASANGGVDHLKKVYVTIYCAGGVWNATSSAVVGDFYFGAVLN